MSAVTFWTWCRLACALCGGGTLGQAARPLWVCSVSGPEGTSDICKIRYEPEKCGASVAWSLARQSSFVAHADCWRHLVACVLATPGLRAWKRIANKPPTPLTTLATRRTEHTEEETEWAMREAADRLLLDEAPSPKSTWFHPVSKWPSGFDDASIRIGSVPPTATQFHMSAPLGPDPWMPAMFEDV